MHRRCLHGLAISGRIPAPELVPPERPHPNRLPPLVRAAVVKARHSHLQGKTKSLHHESRLAIHGTGSKAQAQREYSGQTLRRSVCTSRADSGSPYSAGHRQLRPYGKPDTEQVFCLHLFYHMRENYAIPVLFVVKKFVQLRSIVSTSLQSIREQCPLIFTYFHNKQLFYIRHIPAAGWARSVQYSRPELRYLPRQSQWQCIQI